MSIKWFKSHFQAVPLTKVKNVVVEARHFLGIEIKIKHLTNDIEDHLL